MNEQKEIAEHNRKVMFDRGRTFKSPLQTMAERWHGVVDSRGERNSGCHYWNVEVPEALSIHCDLTELISLVKETTLVYGEFTPSFGPASQLFNKDGKSRFVFHTIKYFNEENQADPTPLVGEY